MPGDPAFAGFLGEQAAVDPQIQIVCVFQKRIEFRVEREFRVGYIRGIEIFLNELLEQSDRQGSGGGGNVLVGVIAEYFVVSGDFRAPDFSTRIL